MGDGGYRPVAALGRGQQMANSGQRFLQINLSPLLKEIIHLDGVQFTTHLPQTTAHRISDGQVMAEFASGQPVNIETPPPVRAVPRPTCATTSASWRALAMQ